MVEKGRLASPNGAGHLRDDVKFVSSGADALAVFVRLAAAFRLTDMFIAAASAVTLGSGLLFMLSSILLLGALTSPSV